MRILFLALIFIVSIKSVAQIRPDLLRAPDTIDFKDGEWQVFGRMNGWGCGNFIMPDAFFSDDEEIVKRFMQDSGPFMPQMHAQSYEFYLYFLKNNLIQFTRTFTICFPLLYNMDRKKLKELKKYYKGKETPFNYDNIKKYMKSLKEYYKVKAIPCTDRYKSYTQEEARKLYRYASSRKGIMIVGDTSWLELPGYRTIMNNTYPYLYNDDSNDMDTALSYVINKIKKHYPGEKFKVEGRKGTYSEERKYDVFCLERFSNELKKTFAFDGGWIPLKGRLDIYGLDKKDIENILKSPE